MALIEVEFLKAPFEATVGLVLKTGRAVPVATLPPLGDDRLLLTFLWQDDPRIEGNFPGFSPPPGTILLRSSVRLTHASVAEIRLQPNTLGSSLTGTVWLLATATLNQVVLTLVGFDPGSGAVPLAVPQPLGALPLPAPNGAGIVAAALVADDSTITLRLATSALDNLAQPPASRLPAFLAEAGAGAANWLVHVPAELFVGMVLDPLVAGLSPPPGGTIVEEAPRASWVQHQGGAWGVLAGAGLEKKDACPGLFGAVDMSVEVTVSARFVEKHDESRIEIGLTIEVNASDWDAFRCWLGSAGFVSLGLGLVNPVLGIVAAIGSLTAVGEIVRGEVGAEAGSLSVDDFTEVSRTTSTVSYVGSVPVDPLPFSPNHSFALGPTGLDIRGTIIPIAPTHAVSFNPNQGSLVGAWASRVNCSLRSMDHAFDFQHVLVADNLKNASKLTLRTDAGEQVFDLDRWASERAPRTAAGRGRVIDAPGQALSLRANRVALIHRGELVIATPLNTLTRENA